MLTKIRKGNISARKNNNGATPDGGTNYSPTGNDITYSVANKNTIKKSTKNNVNTGGNTLSRSSKKDDKAATPAKKRRGAPG